MAAMKNKKTTIVGILLVVGAVLTGVAGVMSGTMTATEAMVAVGVALTGGGFIASTDGGV